MELSKKRYELYKYFIKSDFANVWVTKRDMKILLGIYDKALHMMLDYEERIDRLERKEGKGKYENKN